MQFYKKHFLYITLTLVAIQFSAKIYSSYEEIATENLRSFPFMNQIQNKSFYSYSEYLEWQLSELAALKPFFRRNNLFTFFKDYEKNHPFKSPSVLDFTSSQDLNLLCGTKSHSEIYLAAQVDRTSLELGKVTVLRKINCPTADTEELLNLQAVVRAIVEDKPLFESFEKIFQKLKESENLLFSLWQEDGIKAGAVRKFIRLPWDFKFIDGLNKNPLIMDASERMAQVRDAAFLGAQVAGLVILPTIALLLLANRRQAADGLTTFAREHVGLSSLASALSIAGLATLFIKKVAWNRGTEALNTGMVASNYGMGIYYSWDGLKANVILLNALQAKLMAVSTYVEALKECEKLIDSHPVLKEKLLIRKNIAHLLHGAPKESSDFKLLLELLSTHTFKGEPSFFSSAGNILSAFKLMLDQKDRFGEGLVALGELDFYMSIARLYKEGEGRANTWCFATYDTESDEPYIDSEDFWNPFIAHDRVVANSIAFGTKGNPRTLIITGPNEGGKSTTMIKGAPICLILAQSLGIVPAKRFVFTPFSKIMTYLNIVDDVAAKSSHFAAGVKRARTFVDMSKELKDKEFGFIAIDEVFNGTTYLEGQAAAYSLIEYLGAHQKIVCATATHFPLIAKLEAKTEGKLFKNYKVSVLYDEKGHIRYPFKVEPGISHQYVALDILRERGFEDDFLASARTVLQASAA